jgi:hypothetical protein
VSFIGNGQSHAEQRNQQQQQDIAWPQGAVKPVVVGGQQEKQHRGAQRAQVFHLGPENLVAQQGEDSSSMAAPAQSMTASISQAR